MLRETSTHPLLAPFLLSAPLPLLDVYFDGQCTSAAIGWREKPSFYITEGHYPSFLFSPQTQGKIWSLKQSFLTPQCLIDSFQIPRSYCSVPDSPARCAGALGEVSILCMAPGRPPVVPRIQYNLVGGDLWCWRDLPCDLWSPRLYFPILFCALLFQGSQASEARSCFWKECRVLPSDSHFIFWDTQSDRQQTDNPLTHQIRWWVPEVSSAWKVDFENVGLGVPWVAAFLDSFSEGKPTTRAMLGLESCLFQQDHGFLERNSGSNSVNVQKSRGQGRGHLGEVRVGRVGNKPANLL